MKKKSHTLIVLLVIFLLNVFYVYSSLDVLVEADFLSGKKYEARDVEGVYVEKQDNPDAVLVSLTLFTPLSGIIFEFVPNFCSPNTLFTQTFSVLRC